MGVLGIAFAALAGVTIRSEWENRPTSVDAWWHDLMASHRPDFAGAVGGFLDIFGGTLPMTLSTAAIVVVLLVARRWREAITIGLTVGLASAVCTVLKILIARPRPSDGIVDVGSDSFPSGHTTTAAALAFSIAIAFPRVWTWALSGVWVASMALSRTYLLVHWTSDVLAATVLGASMALLVSAIVTAVFGDRALVPKKDHRLTLKRPSFLSAVFRGNEQDPQP